MQIFLVFSKIYLVIKNIVFTFERWLQTAKHYIGFSPWPSVINFIKQQKLQQNERIRR